VYLSVQELHDIGFTKVGKNPRISNKSSFYGISGRIGDNVRIDDFCVLKGSVALGSFVHIASFGLISGAHAPVEIGDFVTLSARTTVLTGTDDFGAEDSLNNSEYASIIIGPIKIELGTIIGAGALILPNVTVGVGASIGAGCIVFQDVRPGEKLRHASTRSVGTRDHARIKALACRVWENIDGEV